MTFPDPCPECSPSGGNFRIVERKGIEVSERCSCPRGKFLRMADQKRTMPMDFTDFKPTITPRAARQAAMGISMPGYSRDEEALTMVGDELMHLCRNVEQLRWIVRRVNRLYSRWPGLRELRIVFCSKYLPLDGDSQCGNSEMYPEGIPPEAPLLAPALPMLPAGRMVSADPEMDEAIQKAAVSVEMPSPKYLLQPNRRKKA